MESSQRPDHPLLAARTGNLRRRRAANRTMETSAWIAAVLAVAVLVLVIGSVAVKGLSSISLNFLTQNADPNSIEATGGIANALVGTGIMVGLATLMAVPVGILTAIYTNEFAGSRSASTIRYFLDVLNGVPTIVTGIFIFGLIVTAQGHQSGWAGAIALAIVMLPLVARSCQEVLALVPGSVKEAGLALGASRLADDDLGRRPYGAERDDHRRAACGCARAGRDGAAAVRELDLRDQPIHRSLAGSSQRATRHLPVLGIPHACEARSGLGGRVGVDRRRPVDQHRREGPFGSDEASTGGGTLIMENGSKGSASHELSTE